MSRVAGTVMALRLSTTKTSGPLAVAIQRRRLHSSPTLQMIWNPFKSKPTSQPQNESQKPLSDHAHNPNDHVSGHSIRASPQEPADADQAKKKKKPWQARLPIAGIDRILLVSSAKGGVGKSTVAANLAFILANGGVKDPFTQHRAVADLRVGLLDADVFGPSIPRLLGLEGQRCLSDGQGRLIPLRNHGLTCMSMGFLMDPADAVVWRGMMVMSALKKLLRGVAWPRDEKPQHSSGLDLLIIDMPPGTGDVQLTIAQDLCVDGAVVVSTPPEVAVGDARRGVRMFAQTDVPIVGLVQNMSHLVCDSCGKSHRIFGSKDGAKDLAGELGLNFLGDVPIEPRLADAGDQGLPLLLTDAEASRSETARAFRDIAQRVWDDLCSRESQAHQFWQKGRRAHVKTEQ
eukprot:Clim_evm15s33 gene=Clim_evmTU15s33